MTRPLLLALLALVVAAPVATAAARGPSFARAAKVARAHAPGYRLESCVRLPSRTITCALYRDRGAWRWQRTVRVGARRATVSAPRRFCRLRRGPQRCGFRLARR